MMKKLQQLVMVVGICAYAFLGFSPFAGAALAMTSMEMHEFHDGEHLLALHHDTDVENSYATSAHASVECGDACIDASTTTGMDCLEHCLAAAAETDAPITAIVYISFSVAIAIVVAIQLFLFLSVHLHADQFIWQFRPLYIFNTVRLLE